MLQLMTVNNISTHLLLTRLCICNCFRMFSFRWSVVPWYTAHPYRSSVAQWLGRRSLAGDFLWPVSDLWLTSDYFVGKLSAMGQPTSRITGVESWRTIRATTPIIHIITWITTHLPTPEGWQDELSELADL